MTPEKKKSKTTKKCVQCVQKDTEELVAFKKIKTMN